MSNDKLPNDDQSNRDSAAERKLRGSARVGSEPPADHNPETELHLDGEDDSLSSDRIDIKEDSETLFGTRGTSPGVAKP